MSDFDALTDTLRRILTQTFAPKPNYTRGLLGDGLGNVTVPEKPDHNYVRFNRGSTEYFQIFNKTVNPVHGWPVLIGELPWQPGLTQVVGTDWSAYEQSGWGSNANSTPAHAETHVWPDGKPGSDPLDIHLRPIVPGRAYVVGSGSTTVFVNAFGYEYQRTGTVWGGLPGLDLSPVMTLGTGSARMMGVYLDPPTKTLKAVTGSTSVFTDAFDPPNPTFPVNVFPEAYVRIYGSQAGLSETDIRDARRLFTLPDANNGTVPIRTITSYYALTTADRVLLVDASTTGTLVHLPSALGIAGRMFNIKKIDSSNNPVRVSGSHTIDDDEATSIIFQHDAIELVSDGAEWRII